MFSLNNKERNISLVDGRYNSCLHFQCAQNKSKERINSTTIYSQHSSLQYNPIPSLVAGALSEPDPRVTGCQHQLSFRSSRLKVGKQTVTPRTSHGSSLQNRKHSTALSIYIYYSHTLAIRTDLDI